MLKYIIFDLDGTLIQSMWNTLDLVYEELEKVEWTDMELAKYIFTQTMGTALKEQLKMLYKNMDEENIEKLTKKIYSKIATLNSKFFPNAIETVKKLYNMWYKLYLTTWNSTQTAEKHLKEWWIYNLFEIVLWSENIPKWKEHLEIFKEDSQDDNFFQNSIYIWDGNSDREFAKEKNITFIHIWNEKKDKYEINSVDKIFDVIYKLDNF